MSEALSWIYLIIKAVLDWILNLVTTTIGWIKDIILDCFQWILDAFYNLFATITPPDFMNGSMGDWFTGLPALALFYLSQLGIPHGLLMIGSAYAFLFLRKIFTLGQW